MTTTNGCSEYISGTLTISFTSRPTCQQCPLLEWRHGIRHQCAYTGEIVLYPKDEVGRLCPIQFDDKEDNGNGNPRIDSR